MMTLGRKWCVTLIGVAAACAALGQGTITKVGGEDLQDAFVLNVTSNNVGAPTQTVSKDGATLIFDFPATFAGKTTTIWTQAQPVKGYKLGQFSKSPPTARVVAYVTPGLDVAIAKTNSGWSIVIGKGAVVQRVASHLEAVTLSKATSVAAANANPATPPVAVERLETKSMVVTGEQTATASPSRIHAREPASGRSDMRDEQQRVSIEFTDTEVSLIIKALAEQTGANIVTSPEVKGTLSVNLKRVTVEQALDLVTKLSGFRYAKINNTYVVGSGAFLQKVLVHEPTATAQLTSTRVIPLASRKAGEIKRAVVKALSINSINETLRIVHPSESADGSDGPPAAKSEAGTPPPTAPPASSGANGAGVQGGENPPAAANQGAGAQSQGADGKGKADAVTAEGDADYLILIGDRARVEQAAALIAQIDGALADMIGVSAGDAGLRPITANYVVRGGKADELAEAIKTFAGPVSVVATPKTSRAGQILVLHGRPAEVERLIEVLNQIDNVEADGELTYLVYNVKFADPRALRDRLVGTFDSLSVALGPEGASGLSYTDAKAAETGSTGGGGAASSDQGSSSISGGIGSISARPIYNPRESVAVPMKLLLTGSKKTIDGALDMLAAIDRPVPQVAIEARVVDCSKEDIQRFGISWDLLSGGGVSILKFDNSQSPDTTLGGPFNQINGQFGARNNTLNVIATLDKSLNKANFISRPNVIATDGRESVVFVGDVVRYVKSIQVTPTGTNVEIGEEEVGVKLNVMPRISEDGSITMEVQPTVSFIRSFLDTGTGGKIPITAVRTARSTMRIQDGATIAIGGLITEEMRREVSGIPFLMDLPIIGHLFKKTTTAKRRGEIVIFLSVKRIEGDNIGSETKVMPAGKDDHGHPP